MGEAHFHSLAACSFKRGIWLFYPLQQIFLRLSQVPSLSPNLDKSFLHLSK